MRRNSSRRSKWIRCFNPRIPCGMRQADSTSPRLLETFQSTHPMRDATRSKRHFPSLNPAFQSTHPMRDATTRTCVPLPRNRSFNPRIPCGMRLAPADDGAVRGGVSIHASHAGCDVSFVSESRFHFGFNPRIPCGMRRHPVL